MLFSTLATAALAGASLVNAAPLEERYKAAVLEQRYKAALLEDYETYHIRYLALLCYKQHNTTFFEDCCHPLKNTQTLSANREEYCVPNATALARASARVAAKATATITSAVAEATSTDEDEDDYDEDEEEDEIAYEYCAAAAEVDAANESIEASSTAPAFVHARPSHSAPAFGNGRPRPSYSAPAPAAASPSAAPSAAASEAAAPEDVNDGDFVQETSSAAPSASATSEAPAASSEAPASSSEAPAPSPTPSPTPSPSPSPTPAPSPSPSPEPTPSPEPSPEPSTEEPAPTTSSEEPQPTDDWNNNNGGGGSGQTYSGMATFYSQNGVAGACGDYHGDYDMIAALPYAWWPNGYGQPIEQCGQYIVVTRPSTGKQITVKVADACPTCVSGDSVDLSIGAYLQLGTKVEGTFPITWQFA